MAAHDLARHLSNKELLSLTDDFKIPLSAFEIQSPVLLHGPIAAKWLEHDLNVLNPNVLQAVWFHTTGTPDFHMIGKIVFISDKLDPAKRLRFPHFDLMQQIVSEDLNYAILNYLIDLISIQEGRQKAAHPLTYAFKEFLEKQYQI